MNRINIFVEKNFRILFGFFVAVGVMMYLLLIGGNGVWGDEAYTFGLIRNSYKDIWNITAADVHPPLYYFLLKIVIEPFNYNLIAARLFSIFPYVVIIVLGGFQIKKLFDPKTALLFMGLFMFFPFSLLYAIEIRMYSLAAMFVFVNAIYGYRCYKENKVTDWIIFVFAGTCAAYTHYFALVSVGIVYFILLVLSIKNKGMIAEWLTGLIVTILLYLPWLRCFIQQIIVKINHNYWIENITFETLREYFYTLFGARDMDSFAIFFGLTYLIALICIYRAEDREIFWVSICCLVIPLGTILIGVVVSLLVRPIFIIRYVIPAIPLLVLFMAISLGKMKNRLLILLILVIAFIGGISHYSVCIKEEYEIVCESTLKMEFPDKYNEAEGYLNCSSEDRLSSMLAYGDEKKWVYGNYGKGPDVPFINMDDINNFDFEKHECMIIITDIGEKVPGVYLEAYNCEFIGEVDEFGYSVDAYFLEKK